MCVCVCGFECLRAFVCVCECEVRENSLKAFYSKACVDAAYVSNARLRGTKSYSKTGIHPMFSKNIHRISYEVYLLYIRLDWKTFNKKDNA